MEMNRLSGLFEKRIAEFEKREGRKAKKADRTEIAMDLVADEVNKKVAEFIETLGAPKGPSERESQERRVNAERVFWNNYFSAFFFKVRK